MKFFNIDLHISVIEDLKTIFSKLGHTVDSICLSNHNFVFNRSTPVIPGISQTSWRNLDQNMCDRFYEEYKDKLKDYDGFIVTFPPSFSMLYEKFDKPIIMQVPIRFEVPFENKPKLRDEFIAYLQRGIDAKRIIPVANSKYDKEYCEKYIGRSWLHIPNICDYTSIDYSKKGTDWVLYSKNKIPFSHANLIPKSQYFPLHYDWSALNNVKGIVHFPYNISTMSIFEQYTGNIPLFFPSIDFNLELYRMGHTLSEIGWGGNEMDRREHIALADYYDEEWMPHIRFFDSFKDLRYILDSVNVSNVSDNMRYFNRVRKERILEKWKQVLDNLS